MAAKGGSRGAPARAFHRVALRLELADHDVAVIALDLDHAILHRAAGSAAPLQRARELAQRAFVAGNAVDRRDRLAAPPRDLALHAHDAVAVARSRARARPAHALLHRPPAVRAGAAVLAPIDHAVAAPGARRGCFGIAPPALPAAVP